MRTFFKLLLGLLLALMVALGAAVALSWAPDRPLNTLTPRWAQAPSQFVQIEGVQVHLRDEGPRDDPEPIVLLHGTSASLHTWDGWVQALKGQRRVIRMDMPGFGLTGPAADGDYRLPAYARFVLAVMDHQGVQRAVLGGNSLGGEVAWKIAVDQPARVSKLVLVDAAGYPFKSQSVPLGFRLARVAALRPLLDRMLPRRMIDSSVRNVYGHPEKVTPELVDRYYELTLREGNRAALSERFSQSRPGAWADQIRQVRQPTLILWGAQDRLIPPDNAARFARDIPSSEVVMFDDLGHVPQEEDPARTVAAFKTFLGLK